MSEIKIITRENIPCWYELSWQKSPAAIILRIHKKFIEFFESKIKLTVETPIVKKFMEEFRFPSFSGDFSKDFGFNSVFKKRKDEENFIVLAVNIPLIKIEKGKCDSCNGSGKDALFGGKCTFCVGTGKEFSYDWLSAYAISATFTTLFVILDCCRIETDSACFQLIKINTETFRDMHGGSLGGSYGIPLVNFLKRLGPNEGIAEMVEAMKIAHQRLFGELKKYSAYDFRVDLSNGRGWLNVSCPGNACGLNSDFDSSFEENSGYDFSSHNVDSPMQQITLLSGLAALCDLARKSKTV
jgi:hypothetical protein